MYHIKDDKRSQRSAQLIVAGTMTCLAHKSLNDLTITDIVTRSMVGRATFYRLFDSVIDVLALACDQLFTKLGNREATDPESWLLANLQEFMNHDLLLETLVENHQLQLLYDAQHRQLAKLDFLKRHMAVSDDQADFFLADLTYLLVGTLATWINHQKRESAEELFLSLKTTLATLNAAIGD
ncbi:TetR/AcrR family transcriptional regulator [Levilactobacillus brevis]|uniref:TetR/AcrR family transcriptional regulator n=1 Tax=Levilactobacillus brevis TaxID=1580 RepID=UPI000A20B42B|nr:hypothetical protein [Levilactobacillus brevis]ARN89124.1 hypothetical protein AZI09_00235 [Levilactobacillus brevis]ARN96702.1 hypothetical protein AZI10_00235 [Levilactobacillus brevis]